MPGGLELASVGCREASDFTIERLPRVISPTRVEVFHIRWSLDYQKAFDNMKALVATDTLFAYPDHNMALRH